VNITSVSVTCVSAAFTMICSRLSISLCWNFLFYCFITFHGTLCTLLEVHKCFGGSLCLHLQDQSASQARNQQTTWGKAELWSPPASCGFLLVLLFNPEDGGSTVLKYVCTLLPDYMASHLRRQYSSSKRFNF
jgi:hypothetical protein